MSTSRVDPILKQAVAEQFRQPIIPNIPNSKGKLANHTVTQAAPRQSIRLSLYSAAAYLAHQFLATKAQSNETDIATNSDGGGLSPNPGFVDYGNAPLIAAASFVGLTIALFLVVPTLVWCYRQHKQNQGADFARLENAPQNEAQGTNTGQQEAEAPPPRCENAIELQELSESDLLKTP